MSFNIKKGFPLKFMERHKRIHTAEAREAFRSGAERTPIIVWKAVDNGEL